jgi:hypoxanthine phosphoribosyltransferase
MTPARRERAEALLPGQRTHGWLKRDIARVLLSEQALRNRVRELGRRISKDFRGKKVVLVSILKGSVVFLSDLLRSLEIPCAVDFMAVSSYVGSESSGVVRVTMDLRESPEGKNIILVEDIIDTGLTLNYLKESLLARRVRTLKVCALLDKPECHRVPVELDYLGFSIPNEFVVGYGLDYAERYRGLPYVGVLKPAVYAGRNGSASKR